MKNRPKFNDTISPDLAVALQYKYGEQNAPMVVASGKGKLAEVMVKKAEESGVPVKEDQGLAEMLIKIPIGQEVPEELFEVVAQVLAMVYRLDKSTSE